MIFESGIEIFEFMDTDANFLDSPLVWQPPERMSPTLPGLLRLQATSPPRACNQPSRAEAAPSSLPRPELLATSLDGPVINQRSLAELLFPGPQHCSTPGARRPVRLYHTTREVRIHCRVRHESSTGLRGLSRLICSRKHGYPLEKSHLPSLGPGEPVPRKRS